MSCMFNVIHYCLPMCLKIRDKCIEINGLDPAHFLSAPGVVWQACLKKNRGKFIIINRY